MMILFAVLLIAVLMAFSYSSWWNSARSDIDTKPFVSHLVKYTLIVIPLAVAITLVKDAIVIVPAGHRGVVFDKLHGVRQVSLAEGINFITPFLQEAVLFDTRVQKVEFEATAASKDLQSVHTKVALNFRPNADSVYDLYRNFGIDYAEKVIHPAVQEAVKATTALYTAEELITRREEVKNHIQSLLQTQATPAKLTINETYITDFEFSSEFAHAVEAKQIAEQQAFKAKRDLDRVKIEAEQKVAQAQAEARSLAMQRDAITSNLIELRKIEAQKLAIEKWDGHLPQTMLGNTTPMMDVSRLMSNAR